MSRNTRSPACRPRPIRRHLSGLDRSGWAASATSTRALGEYAAVRLFVERAVAVRPGFTVTNENAPAVAAISPGLHGMPLAIELAAARVKILSPDAILPDSITSSTSSPPGRATCRPASRRSVARSPGATTSSTTGRRLLDRLSVFATGCELASARGRSAGRPPSSTATSSTA